MPLLTTLPSLLTSSITFSTLAISIHHYVRTNDPIPGSSKIMKFHNYFYSTCSLCFFLAVTFSVVNSYLEAPPPADTSLWRWLLLRESFGGSGGGGEDGDGDGGWWLRYIYHVSKIYEYQDALYVLANGGEVALHFAVHHLTVRGVFFFFFRKFHTKKLVDFLDI
jgi:hypothetical protein